MTECKYPWNGMICQKLSIQLFFLRFKQTLNLTKKKNSAANDSLVVNFRFVWMFDYHSKSGELTWKDVDALFVDRFRFEDFTNSNNTKNTNFNYFFINQAIVLEPRLSSNIRGESILMRVLSVCFGIVRRINANRVVVSSWIFVHCLYA